MAKQKKNEPSKNVKTNDTIITDNRKARFEYEILETLECGLLLLGSEVKSLRAGKISLEEAYARVQNDEVWLVNCDIPEYKQATIWNHEPKRLRKVLMHRREVLKFAKQAREKGLTLVPLKLYFNERGLAKLLLGLCRGKKMHDKRESIKSRDLERDMKRYLR